jgi:hypothetical protein
VKGFNKSVGMWIVCSVVVVALAPLAEARQVQVYGQSDETYIPTQVDTDGDTRQLATYFISQGTGTFGRVSGTGLTELAPWDNSTFCGPTDVQLKYASLSGVSRIELTGDKYFTKLVDGTLCYDYVDHTYTYSFTTSVTGGTGIFAGATGTLTGTGSGVTLQLDYAGNGVFGANHSVGKGTIELAR